MDIQSLCRSPFFFLFARWICDQCRHFADTKHGQTLLEGHDPIVYATGIAHRMAHASEPAMAALSKAASISAAASGYSLSASSQSQQSSPEQPSERSDSQPPATIHTASSSSSNADFIDRASTSGIAAPNQDSHFLVIQSHQHERQASGSDNDGGLRKTLVRALVAQASILQGAERLNEARHLLRQASSIDHDVQRLFLDPLERLMRA